MNSVRVLVMAKLIFLIILICTTATGSIISDLLKGNEQHSSSTYPQHCGQIYFQGSGVYKIQPLLQQQPIDVYCDMTTDGGGWTVIQRRGSYPWSRTKESFIRTWEEYSRGFGDLNREFWLGNEHISTLTTTSDMQMRVDLKDGDGILMHRIHNGFTISSKETGYTLNFRDSRGSAGEGLSNINKGKEFATYDRENNQSNGNLTCARNRRGGWWYDSGPSMDCGTSNLNGVFLEGNDLKDLQGINWDSDFCLNFAEMKLRPANFPR